MVVRAAVVDVLLRIVNYDIQITRFWSKNGSRRHLPVHGIACVHNANTRLAVDSNVPTFYQAKIQAVPRYVEHVVLYKRPNRGLVLLSPMPAIFSSDGNAICAGSKLHGQPSDTHSARTRVRQMNYLREILAIETVVHSCSVQC
jgi:hypothetical protein